MPAWGPLWSKSGTWGLSYDRVIRDNLQQDIWDIVFGKNDRLLQEYGGAVGDALTSPWAKGMAIIGMVIQSFTSVKMFEYDISFLSISASGFYLADVSFTGTTFRIYTSPNSESNFYLKALDVSLFVGLAWAEGFSPLSVQGTLLEVGYSSKNFDVGLLIGSVGWDFKLEKNSLTIGASWGFGFKITIRW